MVSLVDSAVVDIVGRVTNVVVLLVVDGLVDFLDDGAVED